MKATHGRIDLLFVNVGIASSESVSMIDDAFFDSQFGINVGGAYLVMKHAIDYARRRSITPTSSLSGARGVAGTPFMELRKQKFAHRDDLSTTSLLPVADASTQSVPAPSRRLFSKGRNAAGTNGAYSLAVRAARENRPSRRGRPGGVVSEDASFVTGR